MGGTVGGFCIHGYAVRMCWLCINTLTQHGNEWVSGAKSTRRKKGSQISLQGDMQLKTPKYGIWTPPPPSSFKEQHFMWPENSPGWCTVAYWSPESQMALVSTGRVLVDFINKPGLVRDTDGSWPKRLLYTHLTSYKTGNVWRFFFLHIYHLSSPDLFITHFPCQMPLYLIWQSLLSVEKHNKSQN